MDYDKFIKPVTVGVGGRDYIVSHIPAFTAKAIYEKIIPAIEQFGDIGKSMLPDEVVKTMFAHVATLDDKCHYEVLATEDAVNKYLVDFGDFIELTAKVIEVNFGFFVDGTLPRRLGLRQEGDRESGS